MKFFTNHLFWLLLIFTFTGCKSKTSDSKSIALKPVTENEGAPNGTPKQESPEAVKHDKKHLNIVTWNIANFGKSKDAEEIAFIAKQLRNADFVSVQEVSTGNFGAKAIATLADELNRTGSKWDYFISDPTAGPGPERYAFLWKTPRLKAKGKAWLAKEIDENVDREPFLGRFEFEGKTFLVVNFHAVPTNKNPANEIVHLITLHKNYEADCVFMMGDFNYSESGDAFAELKNNGYLPVLKGQKTSLKMKETESGQSLANEYDNIFFEKSCAELHRSEVIEFHKSFQDLAQARKISDHIPVSAYFSLK
jgi:endonuclease/exonuclease/phosphatase family metal-dependent hydrolase